MQRGLCKASFLEVLAPLSVPDHTATQVPDVNNPVKRKEERDSVTFEGPSDAVYINAPERVALDVGTGAAVQIVSKGWQDVVVVRFLRS